MPVLFHNCNSSWPDLFITHSHKTLNEGSILLTKQSQSVSHRFDHFSTRFIISVHWPVTSSQPSIIYERRRAACLVVTTALLCSSPLGRAATSYFSLSFDCISLQRKQVFLCFAPLYLCARARLLFTVNYGILNQWSIVVLHHDHFATNSFMF